MKNIILIFTLISCGAYYEKNEYPTKNEKNQIVMKDDEYSDLEVKVIKDTATWVDGKTYQFLKVSICFDPIKRKEYEDFTTGTGSFTISYDVSNSRETSEEVLYPISMQSDSVGLFLIDDFDHIGNDSYVTIVYIINSTENGKSVYLYRKQVKLDFNEVKNQNLQKEYPEANSTWYEKWKDENPNFEGKREQYEKRKRDPNNLINKFR